MKIGILTFHRSYNYGAFMQCYSLLDKLKKDFPDDNVEVIDYSSKTALEAYNTSLNNIKNKNKHNAVKERNAQFDESHCKLKMSSKKIISDDFKDMIEYMNDNYDVVVVGSDAVWNWNVRGFPNIYFLKDYKGIKFSYAASAHGMIYQNMTEEQREYIKEAFSEFKYIGARDVTTENMIKFADQSLEVNHNCDPTMFLDINAIPCDMEKLKEKLELKGVDFSKTLVGLMAGEKIGREVKKRYGDKIQLIALYEPNKYADVYLNDLTPLEWSRVFSFFKLTLTHFFHGTMLSLKNLTPVIPVEFVSNFSAVNDTKIKDLMNRLGLLDWRCEADHRGSVFVRGMYKLGIKKDKPLWNEVFKRMDDMMRNDYKDVLKKKIDVESESYNSFFEELKKCKSLLQEEKEND